MMLQILQKSRSHVHKGDTKQVPYSDPKFWKTCEPHCYLTLFAQFMWTDTRLCKGGKLQSLWWKY